MTNPIKDEWQSDDGSIRLLLGDCLEILPTLEAGSVDAVVTDPEYGIGWNPRVNHKDAPWRDQNRFDPTPWLKIGKYHVFWGGNYFADKLPISDGWISWIKRPIDGRFHLSTTTYSTVELAWTDFGKTRFVKHVWDGGMREGAKQNRKFLHPAQKPVEVMEYCLPPRDAVTICDCQMGSGTTGVACIRTGRRFIGIEIEPKYFEIAVQRCKKALKEDRSSFQIRPKPRKAPEGFFSKEKQDARAKQKEE